MAYFYVDSTVDTDGLGNSYATEQTGSFVALTDTNVYGSILEAINDGASGGDVICVSSDHAYSHSGSDLLYNGGSATPLVIIGVEALNCDQLALIPGYETTDGLAYDIVFNSGLIDCINFTISPQDLIRYQGTSATYCLNKCNLVLLNSGNDITLSNADSTQAVMQDCDIDLNYSSNNFFFARASYLEVNNCVIGATTSGSIDNLISSGFTAGGGQARFIGTDLSLVDGYIVHGTGGGSSDSMIDVTIDKCQLNPNVNFNNETFIHLNQHLLVTQSSSSSSTAEYQYFWHTRGGTVQDQDSAGVYRDESTPYLLSGEKVSLHCLTDSNASKTTPFRFKFPTRVAELSGATDTIRIYFVSTTTIDDSMVYARAIYTDGTNNQEFNSINSLVTPANLPEDIFRTPGSYTDDSSGSTWKNGASDLTGYNEYYMDLDTSSDAGADCVPAIMVYATEPNISIYFDTTIDVVGS